MTSIGNSSDSVQFFPQQEPGSQEEASVTFLPRDLAANMQPPKKPLPKERESLDTPPSFHSKDEVPVAPRQAAIKPESPIVANAKQNPIGEASIAAPRQLDSKPPSATVLASAKLNAFAGIVKDVLASGIFKWSPIQNAKLRKNMLEQCLEAKRQFLPEDQRPAASLTSKEIDRVNRQVDAIIKVNSSRKSKYKAVDPDRTKANWTVRNIDVIKIGGLDIEVHMGRNHKAMIVYKTAGAVIGKGNYGAVSPVGIDVKKGLGVLVKESDAQVMNELKNEIAMTQELHEKAGGFQTGIQRSPYSLRSTENGSKATVFVHRYETDLHHFKNKDLARYGFTGKHPEAQLVHGLFNGLAAMHKNGMAHRDIKPGNSGIQKNDKNKYESCLADFGAAVKKSTDNKRVFGTPLYVSVFDQIYQKKDITPERRLDLRQKQDVFALGKTALELMTNRVHDRTLYNAFLPFVHDPDRKAENIETSHPIENPVILEALQQVTKTFGEPTALMLAKMISADPDERPTIQEAAFVINALASGSIKDTPVTKKNPFELTGNFIGSPHVQEHIKQLIENNRKLEKYDSKKLSDAEIANHIEFLSNYEQGADIVSALETLKALGLTYETLRDNSDLLNELCVIFNYKLKEPILNYFDNYFA